MFSLRNRFDISCPSAVSAVVLAFAIVVALGVSSASAASPMILSSAPTAVTATTSVLKATINPEGEATTYHFEYGLADCASNLCTSDPIPDGNVGSANSPVSISREIDGLASGTTYHFRVVATNGSGATPGPDQSFTTYDPFVTDTSCPNQAVRYGSSANLPDCRAYEMVSPVDKDGGEIRGQPSGAAKRVQFMQSALDGNKITYSSYKAFGDATSGAYVSQYMASRGANGWLTHGISPPQGTSINDPFFELPELENMWHAFTPDLSTAWVKSYNAEKLVGTDGLEGHLNLYRRDNADDGYEALTNAGPFGPSSKSLNAGSDGQSLRFQGSSSDLSHQIFTAAAALTPEAVPNEKNQLYDLSDGSLSLVSILPNGEPSPDYSYAGNFGSLRNSNVDHAVSDDGSRVFWTSSASGDFGEGGKVFVRIDGTTTLPVSELATAGAANFWAASADGSKAIFSAGGLFSSAAELYEVDVDNEAATLIAGEVRGVAGASDDGSYVYFVSKEDLAAGATAGELNLYLDHEGSKTFLATLSGQDVSNPSSVVGAASVDRSSRVTPSGHQIVFMSTRGLTGYDNTDAASGKPDTEVFRYDVNSEELTCVSCRPSNVRPSGQRLVAPYAFLENDVVERESAAWIPTREWELNESQVISDDGDRVFFNSYDALLPADVNGVQDVYQWEAQGSGTCQKAGGCISLISTGQSPVKSEFVDASASGGDVFFTTESSIDPEDPGLVDIYVARVGGGYPRPTPPTPCLGDACQSVPPAPAVPTSASASFHGAGTPSTARQRRNCRARKRQAGGGNRAAERKRVKRCRRANRRAVR